MINKDESPQTFLITIKVRDANGMIFKDVNGFKVPNINFEKTVHTWKQLEFQMQGLARDFEAITPRDSDISIEAGVNNRIGGTIMNMASYYGSEKRFVKH